MSKKSSQKGTKETKRLPNKVYVAWVDYSDGPNLTVAESPEELAEIVENINSKFPVEAGEFSLLTYVQINKQISTQRTKKGIATK